jgi:hypothetical protein
MSVAQKTPVRRDYALALRALQAARVPFVVGGGWALEHYARLLRPSADLDLMLDPASATRAEGILVGEGAEILDRSVSQTRLAFRGGEIDLVHHFAQGTIPVDRDWYQRGVPARVFDVASLVAAPEDLIWSKVFVAARHRFDGADVVHLLRATHDGLDWRRLRTLLEPYPSLLLAYLSLFEYVYPQLADGVPQWLWDDLLSQFETLTEPGGPNVCRGSLLDRTSFEFDEVAKGFTDSGRSAA